MAEPSIPDLTDPGKHIPLKKLRPMEPATVVELNAPDEEAARLKQLGICSGRRIQMVQPGDPLVLRVLGSRIGLSARLADCVTVVSCRDWCDAEPDAEAQAP